MSVKNVLFKLFHRCYYQFDKLLVIHKNNTIQEVRTGSYSGKGTLIDVYKCKKCGKELHYMV